MIETIYDRPEAVCKGDHDYGVLSVAYKSRPLLVQFVRATGEPWCSGMEEMDDGTPVLTIGVTEDEFNKIWQSQLDLTNRKA